MIEALMGGIAIMVTLFVVMLGIGAVVSPSVEADNRQEYQKEITNWSVSSLDWIRVPGKIEQVKEMSFKDCKSNYYHYECTSDQSSLFGVPLKEVRISLDAEGHLPYSVVHSEYSKYKNFSGDVRQVPMEDLGYDTIYLSLASDDWNSACMDKLNNLARQQGKERVDEYPFGKPKQCLKNKGLSYFLQTLKEQGWKYTSSNDGEFIHPNYNVKIRSERVGADYSMSQILTKDRDYVLEKLKQEEIKSQQLQINEQKTLDFIKSSNSQ